MRNPFARVSDPGEFVTSPGNRYETEYTSVIEKDGSISLKESGKIDLQVRIESFRDSTDMAFILNRLKVGDVSVLNQKVPMYGDFENAPKSLFEAMDMLQRGEDEFMKLDKDVRAAYGDSFRAWLLDAGSDSWYKAMAPYFEKESESVSDVKEVHSDES